ncbi:MFS transporter [Streptomyces hiroshimensis]|uniref:MFS transporter n=1 Tax=Streptomyces hiroshimensis TaxID=66424 RepID=A0ABQ2Z6X0_9ACTN|nr:MFS transporter [Streptomyces hiroshimensis]GGY03085.1 MFS transporter [Streptomyces hiroshimensis]
MQIPGGPDGRRMLAVTFVDRTGSGLWGATAVLYFTYVAGLGTAQIGLLLGVSGAIGIAGPPLGGLLADRVPLRTLLATVQALRAVASLALLTTTDLGLLIAITAVGSLGDRASSVLTKLYATRIAGPDRSRYQAVNRTVSNVGWAVGGLAAAAALAAGTTAVYRWLLVGDALSFVAVALLTLRCGEPPSASRVVKAGGPAAGSGEGREGAEARVARVTNPWRDRRYLAYTATEAVLCLDDSVFKVGLALWAVTATPVPHGIVPLLLVLNNVLVVCFQVPFARFGTTSEKARTSLFPLAAAFLAGGAALAASATGTRWIAVAALTLAATAFTVAEMLHATVSWELSVALAPPTAQGAYLGVHGLASAVQRSIGPVAVTGTIAAGPLGWLGFGAGLAVICLAQRRLTRDDGETALSVPRITVSEH